ncbi:AzlD domain-containing protein [Slackia heliotrinireducens]|uniref:Predicted membrane protein n=1 Tax=Slackia heliotrinireducens (strain ATCC 29202 / DSM 20476 / NCTC 11029 / RHS 1) TaxID=471855 RepID=C7N610_SLAHD|nr:AzlD domain-containing protein [Slackia heliotrinireducens]ACV22345.1 predicted membrane protein [Slackia heliotrinireducens DSM 20476]VEH00594.1 Predicted membrane protein [Slackia heliotrinireducens]
MSVQAFFLIFGLCSITMLISRVAPMFLLKGKELPDTFVTALGFIPPAAFAALVTNDLFKPELFSQDVSTWLFPMIAAAIVVVVGVKTKSMAWCIVAGVGTFAALIYVPGLVF